MNFSRKRVVLMAATCALASGGMARGILFSGTGDPSYHASEPVGPYDGAGWQYQGVYGLVLGTVISPTHFITAAHADSPVDRFIYQGNSYGIISKSVIPGTDLLVAEVNSPFSEWASLYTGSAPIGSEVVIMGMGGPRGSEIRDAGGRLQGWSTSSTDGTMRWGVNEIEGTRNENGLGELLVASFGADPAEAGLSRFDSGGGVFVLDGDGIWKLAGITYGADTFSSTASGSGAFLAALFDPSGFYRQENGEWIMQTEEDAGTRYYFSSISASSSRISAITHIPEVSFISLLGTGSLLLALRRRRIGRTSGSGNGGAEHVAVIHPARSSRFSSKTPRLS